ncbi:hypothetical protein THAOC_33521 [Thalassiosira oceanica]|uniref:RxLR effector protein n=1 Tax=Thalassiosira oceanica TaxID=159749 RepID=K0R422_THAOC|nr:hypothetical protein THAOC_33521 [Thalassiosira oceanica]|eukprot:EJK47743.1 hypothetical protein THAOC_33521 [Thalassiosira oceanica]
MRKILALFVAIVAASASALEFGGGKRQIAKPEGDLEEEGLVEVKKSPVCATTATSARDAVLAATTPTATAVTTTVTLPIPRIAPSPTRGAGGSTEMMTIGGGLSTPRIAHATRARVARQRAGTLAMLITKPTARAARPRAVVIIVTHLLSHEMAHDSSPRLSLRQSTPRNRLLMQIS